MSPKIVKEARILFKSTLASIIIGALAFLFFEILIRTGFSPALCSVVSTVILSILSVPLLKLSFESSVELRKIYIRYGILASLYTLIVYLTFPSFNTYFVEVLHVSDLLSLVGLKVMYYPFYYIIGKYYVFR